MPKVPWRYRISSGPKPKLGGLRLAFKIIPFLAFRSLTILVVNPAVTSFNDLSVENPAIHGHYGYRSVVTVLGYGKDLDFFPKYLGSGELFGLLPKILMLLRTINPIETNFFALSVVKDSNAVAICYSHHFALPGPSRIDQNGQNYEG
jgi:hypothetical protein